MSFRVGDASILEYRYSSQGNDFYGLNGSKLNAKECHLFYICHPCEEHLLAIALEYFVFHPNNKVMNDKFKFSLVKCGSIHLCWVSFPKEFQDVCERTAKVYGMTMKIMSRKMVEFEGKTATFLDMPEQKNLLTFQVDGNRCADRNKILKQIQDVVWLGNSIEKQGLD